MNKQCVECAADYSYARYKLGYNTCLHCGEQAARQRKHCIVPMHKSNYVPVTNLDDLKGINNKGGFFR
jgi:ribosomal protein L37AE/L43A